MKEHKGVLNTAKCEVKRGKKKHGEECSHWEQRVGDCHG